MLYLRIPYQIRSQIFTPMFSKIFMVLTLKLFIHLSQFLCIVCSRGSASPKPLTFVLVFKNIFSRRNDRYVTTVVLKPTHVGIT